MWPRAIPRLPDEAPHGRVLGSLETNCTGQEGHRAYSYPSLLFSTTIAQFLPFPIVLRLGSWKKKPPRASARARSLRDFQAERSGFS